MRGGMGRGEARNLAPLSKVGPSSVLAIICVFFVNLRVIKPCLICY